MPAGLGGFLLLSPAPVAKPARDNTLDRPGAGAGKTLPRPSPELIASRALQALTLVTPTSTTPAMLLDRARVTGRHPFPRARVGGLPQPVRSGFVSLGAGGMGGGLQYGLRIAKRPAPFAPLLPPSPVEEVVPPSEGVIGFGVAVDEADIGAGDGNVVVSGDGAGLDVADDASASGNVVVGGTAAAVDVADTGAGVSSVVDQGAGTATDASDVTSAAGNVVDSGDGSALDAADAANAASSVVIQGAAVATDAADVGAGVGGIVETGLTGTLLTRVTLAGGRSETGGVVDSATPVRSGAILVVGANTLTVPTTAQAVMIRVSSGSAHVVLKGSAGDTGVDLGTLTSSSPAIVLPLSSASVVLESSAAMRLAVFWL